MIAVNIIDKAFRNLTVLINPTAISTVRFDTVEQSTIITMLNGERIISREELESLRKKLISE